MTLKLYTLALTVIFALSSQAQITPQSQMEKLDRGLVAIPVSSTSSFVSWRLLGTDVKESITFDLLRNGEAIATDLKVTNYRDANEPSGAKYQVVTKIDGQPIATSETVTTWKEKFLTLNLDRPKGGIHKSWNDATDVPYSYYPNDMSVGDVDGDGQYELFLKWESTHAQDNSYNKGYTGNTYIDCYKVNFDGTEEIIDSKSVNCKLLWRIDLGQNIRDGAHYTQFMVYDFDGDGRAEMMCKTLAYHLVKLPRKAARNWERSVPTLLAFGATTMVDDQSVSLVRWLISTVQTNQPAASSAAAIIPKPMFGQ